MQALMWNVLGTRRGVATMAQDGADVDSLSEALDISDDLTGWDWLTAGIILVAAVALSRLAKVLLRRGLRARGSDEAIADLLSRLLGYTIVVFGLVYALEWVGVAVGPLLGALGIIGIALAFALRDILENFVAGLLLQFRRPFSYGDQIVSGEIEGTVRSIDARSVTIETPDGETVHLPSSKVITDAIVNHTEHGVRRTTLQLGVAYGTDVRTILELLGEIGAAHPDVLENPGPRPLFVGHGDSSLDFVLRCWTGRYDDFMRVQSDLNTAVNEALKAGGFAPVRCGC